METQALLAYALLAMGLAYLLYRFVFKKLNRSSKDHDCGPDCNCS